MKLVVGLGNPGSKYKRNRHNIGFWILDKLAKSYKIKFKRKKLFDFAIHKEIYFLKPRTYMNRSGDAITSIRTSHKVDDMLILLDDINLELGEIRLREKGGFGGHNGLRSIGRSLGSKKFNRFRIGVGNPDAGNLSDYVLSNFTKEEKEKLNEVYNFSRLLLEEYFKTDFNGMLDKYSRLKKTYSEKF